MANLILAFNVVLPLCLCMVLGYFLRVIGMMKDKDADMAPQQRQQRRERQDSKPSGFATFTARQGINRVVLLNAIILIKCPLIL